MNTKRRQRKLQRRLFRQRQLYNFKRELKQRYEDKEEGEH